MKMAPNLWLVINSFFGLFWQWRCGRDTPFVLFFCFVFAIALEEDTFLFEIHCQLYLSNANYIADADHGSVKSSLAVSTSKLIPTMPLPRMMPSSQITYNPQQLRRSQWNRSGKFFALLEYIHVKALIWQDE